MISETPDVIAATGQASMVDRLYDSVMNIYRNHTFRVTIQAIITV